MVQVFIEPESADARAGMIRAAGLVRPQSRLSPHEPGHAPGPPREAIAWRR